MTRTAMHAMIAAMRGGFAFLMLGFAVWTAPAHAACDPAPAVESRAAASPIVPGYEVEPVAAPSPLSELATDSPWRARFAAAADELLPALLSGDPARWQLLLGGRWLGASDRAKVAALLADRCGPFAPLAAAGQTPARRIFGWALPSGYTSAERAEIAAQPEAEALVCWSARDSGAARWPETAAEADNARGRAFACARIAYSVRDGTPRWRAFVEGPA